MNRDKTQERQPRPRAADIGYNQWEKTASGLPIRLKLFDQSGNYIRTLWEVPNGWGQQEVMDFMVDGAHRHFAERKATETRRGMILKCWDREILIHSYEHVEKLCVPDLSVETLEPRHFDSINQAVRCSRVDDAAFQGWALLVQDDLGLFASCLLLLDDDFQERGMLYHPGRLKYLVVKDGLIVISGTLNARATGENHYRPVLFQVSLRDLIGQVFQVAPYSPLTIPSLKRRNYYRFKDIPEYQPAVYLALPPIDPFEILLNESGNQLLVESGLDRHHRIQLIFSWDLDLLDKRVADHQYTGDFEKDYYATRFQYWEGDHWGPWQAETPP